MADRFTRIARAVRECPWAILPEVFGAMLEVIELRLAGGRFTEEEVDARIGPGLAAAQRQAAGLPIERVGAVAVLPLHGVLSQRMNLFSAISGGTSMDVFGKAFDEAMNDPEVQAIVLDVDSPGGSVAGTAELAQKVYRARGSKPIVAVANSLAASAAYWVGAQADQFVASPSSRVGSIGIVISHTDVSKAEEAAGVKTSVLSIPDAKTEGHPYAPLSEEARANVLASLQPFYEMFIKGVAQGRGVAVPDVRDGYGNGRVLASTTAKDAGMVDRIETLQDAINRLQTPQGRRAALRAIAGDTSLRATSETTAQEPAKATAQESAPTLKQMQDELTSYSTSVTQENS